MQSKLLLTLWLLGAVLYAGSTIFLAQAVLGGIGGDKSKPITLAAAAETQCPKPDTALDDAAPAKTAAIEPKQPKPAAPQASPNKDKPEAANRDSASPLPASEPDESASESAPSPGAAWEDNATPTDEALLPDGWDGQGAGLPNAGQDSSETDPSDDDWASVVAGTADMRSEPSLQAPLIYALPAGWHVRVISRQPGWVQVQDANSGAAGWVEATALASSAGPGTAPGYGGGYGPRYGQPYRPQYADEGYPEPHPWQRPWHRRGGEFGDFLRRALGGF